MSEDLKKSADALVEETLASLGVEEAVVETVTEDIAKGANPFAKDDDKKDGDDKEEKDKDGDDKKEKKKADDKDDIKKSDEPVTAPIILRKSLAELAEILTEDELTVISAWREELDSHEVEVQIEETIVKSQPAEEANDLVKSLTTKFENELGDIRKALTVKDDLIKSLGEKIEVLSAQPAHSPKAISDLSVTEVPAASPTLTKSFVLKTMSDLQKSDKGVDSRHITEFELTGKISNPHVNKLVLDACKKS